MEIDEKEITSSSVPDEKFEEASIIKDSEIEINDTSEETPSAQRTLRLTISENVRSSGRFNIDIEREEEKELFSKLNQELKKIK